MMIEFSLPKVVQVRLQSGAGTAYRLIAPIRADAEIISWSACKFARLCIF